MPGSSCPGAETNGFVENDADSRRPQGDNGEESPNEGAAEGSCFDKDSFWSFKSILTRFWCDGFVVTFNHWCN